MMDYPMIVFAMTATVLLAVGLLAAWNRKEK